MVAELKQPLAFVAGVSNVFVIELAFDTSSCVVASQGHTFVQSVFAFGQLGMDTVL